MQGLLSHGIYVPHYRLQLAETRAALGAGPASGSRAVASHDQDSTCLGYEAARRATARAAVTPAGVAFATSSPVYADRTNATAIHAALDLPRAGEALDLGSTPRAAFGALRAAARSPEPALAVLADQRDGLAGSPDELLSGDGGAAFVFGEGEPVAEVLADASVTQEFLDRWRAPGEPVTASWDERFGAEVYGPLVDEVVRLALERAGIEQPDHVVVSSPHRRAAAAARRRLGDGAPTWIDREVGYTGAADLGLRLADVLERARAGETILVVSAADGADALVLGVRRAAGGTSGTPAGHTTDISYTTFLTWRGRLERERPRRPDPDRPAAPPSSRNVRWKFGFVGSACEACGAVHLPPQRVCLACHEVDRMQDRAMRDARGRISTYTVDRLAPSLDPPTVDVVVDFEGGGRFSCQLTEGDAQAVRIGDAVEMTFRRVFAYRGVHNYFWKAKPVLEAQTT
ncbi:MAG TPA: OB-fold domain-containing protein [Baekduia sp.]|nr:OB-fold domain-containing protein [Baekduia sp.]